MDIFVATHKKLDFSLPEGYRPMQVNCKAAGSHWEGYLHDDEGINISEKNYCYCELTVLYSLWKNSDADIKGLCHYRRYLTDDAKVGIGIWKERILTGAGIGEAVIREKSAEKLLRQYDIILPIPMGPLSCSIAEERLKFCYRKDLDALRATIEEDFPEYKAAYERVMGQNYLSVCNLCIAKKDRFDAYCEWLFAVLEKTEARCDIESYDTQHKRLYGYLAEILINVYVLQHKLKCAYVNRVILEEFWWGNTGKSGWRSRLLHSPRFRRVLNAAPGACMYWFYKLRGETAACEEYLALKRYLREREAETIR